MSSGTQYSQCEMIGVEPVAMVDPVRRRLMTRQHALLSAGLALLGVCAAISMWSVRPSKDIRRPSIDEAEIIEDAIGGSICWKCGRGAKEVDWGRRRTEMSDRKGDCSRNCQPKKQLGAKYWTCAELRKTAYASGYTTTCRDMATGYGCDCRGCNKRKFNYRGRPVCEIGGDLQPYPQCSHCYFRSNWGVSTRKGEGSCVGMYDWQLKRNMCFSNVHKTHYCSSTQGTEDGSTCEALYEPVPTPAPQETTELTTTPKTKSCTYSGHQYSEKSCPKYCSWDANKCTESCKWDRLASRQKVRTGGFAKACSFANYCSTVKEEQRCGGTCIWVGSQQAGSCLAHCEYVQQDPQRHGVLQEHCPARCAWNEHRRQCRQSFKMLEEGLSCADTLDEGGTLHYNAITDLGMCANAGDAVTLEGEVNKVDVKDHPAGCYSKNGKPHFNSGEGVEKPPTGVQVVCYSSDWLAPAPAPEAKPHCPRQCKVPTLGSSGHSIALVDGICPGKAIYPHRGWTTSCHSKDTSQGGAFCEGCGVSDKWSERNCKVWINQNQSRCEAENYKNNCANTCRLLPSLPTPGPMLPVIEPIPLPADSAVLADVPKLADAPVLQPPLEVPAEPPFDLPPLGSGHFVGMVPGVSNRDRECMADEATKYLEKLDTNWDSYGMTLGVTCCSKNVNPVSASRPDCKQKLNFQEATRHCDSKGQRLCSLEELSKYSKGTGCSFDLTFQWTADPCPPPRRFIKVDGGNCPGEAISTTDDCEEAARHLGMWNGVWDHGSAARSVIWIDWMPRGCYTKKMDRWTKSVKFGLNAHPKGDNYGKYIALCKQPYYAVDRKNCEAGGEIFSLDECRLAAESLGMWGDRTGDDAQVTRLISQSHVPAGCWTRRSNHDCEKTNTCAFAVNTLLSARNSGNYRVVCKALPNRYYDFEFENCLRGDVIMTTGECQKAADQLGLWFGKWRGGSAATATNHHSHTPPGCWTRESEHDCWQSRSCEYSINTDEKGFNNMDYKAVCKEHEFNGHYTAGNRGEECIANDATEHDKKVNPKVEGTAMTVSCCSDEKASRPGCKKGLNFKDALQVCASKGLRLCTREEIEFRAMGTGCNFDNTLQWTSDPCEWFPTVPGHMTAGASFAMTRSEECIADGDKTYDQPLGTSWDSKKTLGVTCCDDTDADGTRPGCKENVGYEEAKKICEDAGKRLCTVPELNMRGKGFQVGCGFDETLQWVSESCLAPVMG